MLKRLDDPTDKVRVCAAKALPLILKDPPKDFLTHSFSSHHDFVVTTLLTHFDDDDDAFQQLIFGNAELYLLPCYGL